MSHFDFIHYTPFYSTSKNPIQPSSANRRVVEPFMKWALPGRRHLIGRLGDRRVRARLQDGPRPGGALTRPRATSTSTSRTATTASGPGCASSRRSRSSCGAGTTGWSRSRSRGTSSARCRRRVTSRSTACSGHILNSR